MMAHTYGMKKEFHVAWKTWYLWTIYLTPGKFKFVVVVEKHRFVLPGYFRQIEEQKSVGDIPDDIKGLISKYYSKFTHKFYFVFFLVFFLQILLYISYTQI